MLNAYPHLQESLLAAMGRLGMSLDDQEEFMRVVAGALHLTQVEFEEGTNDEAKVANAAPLHKCAELWGVDEAQLATSIINKEKKFGKEINLIPLSPANGERSPSPSSASRSTPFDPCRTHLPPTPPFCSLPL